MGQEIGREEVIRNAKKLVKYLREEEHIADADIDFALQYWQAVLEKKYHG